MLVISRKEGETVLIGEDIEIKIVSVDGGNIKLAISAPDDVGILRKEIYERIKEENKIAVNKSLKALNLLKNNFKLEE
ncbi:carbon storage regulator CsrA [Clostridioides difficile]|uniref:carbon storage regulator CsrA n=1 Tax=Clostridioides difficile TaxID=1496 RepID=UPI00030DB585|nr:carbon storage regulator CsrA [Clostridioides difficile]AXU48562.1 carbon storage regulator [Clostridioides difficile]AXU73984.1 carbon storage regulator [Clostridioides difficile]EGT2197535.1 carbon storage regulator CsrA [Clostridioides difficile]EGT4047168.1 carbon storage regulator [Clostridioides difficile]EGT4222912.1 carbon storage regulator [Clostridioides difficile]